MNRRKYLATLGGAMLALSGCSEDTPDQMGDRQRTSGDGPKGTAESGADSLVTTVRKPGLVERFDEVVDIVEETGCDPTGQEDCADAIETAAQAGRALSFPSGRFRISRPVTLTADGPIGCLSETDATLVPDQGFNGMPISIESPAALFEGLDIDIRQPNTTAGLSVTVEDWFRVADITYHGRGDHSGPSSPFAFDLVVRSPSGYGLARNLTAKKGAAIGHYKGGGGRGGMWIGPPNKGTIRVQDCELSEFANNGIYGSRTAGNVEVVGGTYRNNNVCSLRFGGRGSFARNVSIEVDIDDYDGPRTRFENQFATRGIVVEQGPTTNIKPPGAVIQNCSITMASSPTVGSGVSAWSTGRTIRIINTSITVDIPDSRAVFRAPRIPSGDRPPSGFPRYVEMENVEISGSASELEAVRLHEAPNSVFRNCRITHESGQRDGIRLIGSPDSVLDGGQIKTSGTPVYLTELRSVPTENCLFSVQRTPTIGDSQTAQTTDTPSATQCLSRTQIPDRYQATGIRILAVEGDRLFFEVEHGEA